MEPIVFDAIVKGDTFMEIVKISYTNGFKIKVYAKTMDTIDGYIIGDDNGY